MNLEAYIMKHARRGSCKCGKCIDAPDEVVPAGPHSVNLTFFEVSADFQAYANPNAFIDLVKAEHPEWLDGQEHSYIEIGAAMGDQGLALMTIGLGHLVGAWKALSPDIIFPSFPKEMKMQMAGSGMVSMVYSRPVKL